MLEIRKYISGDRVEQEVHISHGASESVILWDSTWPEEHDGWGQPLKKQKKWIDQIKDEVLAPAE